MTKRKTKFGSVKRDPLLQQLPGLAFDNLDPAQVIELTDSQKATAFISRYLATEHPISNYRAYFESSIKGEAWELKELKGFFIELVIANKWSEEKLIAVVNSIYRDNQIMSIPSVDARGRMYDQGRLVDPKEQIVSSRRKGRI